MYGALTGLSKKDTAEKIGHDLVQSWYVVAGPFCSLGLTVHKLILVYSCTGVGPYMLARLLLKRPTRAGLAVIANTLICLRRKSH